MIMVKAHLFFALIERQKSGATVESPIFRETYRLIAFLLLIRIALSAVAAIRKDRICHEGNSGRRLEAPKDLHFRTAFFIWFTIFFSLAESMDLWHKLDSSFGANALTFT